MQAANNWHWAICDVHRLIDHDASPRVCFYCGQCDAEICIDDANRLDRRLKAAWLRRMEKMRQAYGLSA